MYTKLIVAALAFALAPLAWPIPAPAQIKILPGSAARGAELLHQKRCIECHSFDGSGQERSPMQLASALWNHSPDMWRAQKTRNVRPALDSLETADLFAYFFSLAYFRTPGDPQNGQVVF